MKLQYCSDLHLEFPLNEQLMKKYPLELKGDMLILAGDIVPFAVMERHKYFFDFVADNYAQTFWLPGNHEYYHSDIAGKNGILNEKIRSNVSLVNNVSIHHDGIDLIFSTLWSKINLAHEWQIERALSDFHVIKYHGYRFSVPVYNQLHSDSITFLKQVIADSNVNNKIVVTHHVPTFMHYPKQYVGDILNEAFATELFDLIEASDIHTWIYGHHHNNTPDFTIGATTMRTNQLGYVKHGENRDFNRRKFIKIGF